MDSPRTAHEEFSYPVRTLSLSTLYLNKNQAYRGYCILIYDVNHVTRIDQLPDNQWLKLARDIHVAETAIFKAMQPDHVNIASIGMIVPHLHWHIIPRYVGDARWGGPIWTTDLDDMAMVKLQEEDYISIIRRINEAIDGIN